MKRTLSKFLLIFLMSFLLGGGIERSASLSAQRLLPGQRPFRKASILKKRRNAPSVPAYWVKDILRGGSLKSLLPTDDGGFFVSGNAPLPLSNWSLKLNSDGTVAWAAKHMNSLSALGIFRLNGIIPTADGNVIGAAGFNSGNTEAAVVKFTPDGDVLWAKYYGGPHVDHAYWISQAQDGGFFVTGNCISYWGGGPSDASYDAWVIKIDPAGAVEWERAFACLDEEAFFMEQRGQSGIQLADGGYAVVANTRVAGSGEYDFLLIKLDASGHVEWQKTYGGPGYESLFRKGPHLQATADGGMILAGSTTSFGSGNTDIWVLKLTAGGDIEWQKAIGGYEYEYCNSIRVAPDGGYILAGDAGGRFGLVKLSADGEVEWDRGFAGQYAETVAVAGDGSYLMGGKNGSDVLIMKVSPQGLISDSCGFGDSPQNAVQDTNAIPMNVWFEPSEVHPCVEAFDASFDKGPVIFAETLCWSLNQPPIPVSLEKSVNRGLFRGEAFNTLTWKPHPANASFPIAQYRVYRRGTGGATSSFTVIGTVPGNYLVFVDSYSDLSQDYEYALTSVDDEGHESPKAIVIGGELVR